MTENGYIPQADYFQILRLVPIVCVDVAIVRGDKVLLVKRKDKPAQGEWWFPGGRVYKGESLRQAALRKAQEEVGLKCKAGEIIHTAETVFEDGPEGIPVHSVNTIFFLSPVDDSQVILDNSHSTYLWVDAKWVKANDNDLDSYMIEGLEKVFNPYYVFPLEARF